MKPWIPLALAGAALGALAACGDATGGSSDGAELYSKLCSTCHGPDGKPPPAMEQRLGVRDLTDPALRARLTPALVERQVRFGSGNKLMPAFEGAITDAQIRALAAYVAGTAFVTGPGSGR